MARSTTGPLSRAARASSAPEARLTAIAEAFVDYGVDHPAFVDGAQSLMSRTGDELREEISEAALFRLGQAMTGCLSILAGVLEQGRQQGRFGVRDPDLLANQLYAAALGVLQLGRVGIVVRESDPGVPRAAEVSPAQIRHFLVTTAHALATA